MPRRRLVRRRQSIGHHHSSSRKVRLGAFGGGEGSGRSREWSARGLGRELVRHAAGAVDHFEGVFDGVLGRTFPTPFSSSPFRGLSSSRVNVVYGLCNLAVAYALLLRV